MRKQISVVEARKVLIICYISICFPRNQQAYNSGIDFILQIKKKWPPKRFVTLSKATEWAHTSVWILPSSHTGFPDKQPVQLTTQVPYRKPILPLMGSSCHLEILNQFWTQTLYFDSVLGSESHTSGPEAVPLAPQISASLSLFVVLQLTLILCLHPTPNHITPIFSCINQNNGPPEMILSTAQVPDVIRGP